MSKICPHCNEQVRTTDIFCPFCGGDLSKAPVTSTSYDSPIGSQSNVMCSYCGVSNVTNTQYCSNCGTPFSSSSSSSSSIGKTSQDSFDNFSGQPTHSFEQQESHSYGSYSTYSSTEEKKWYTPPKRTRSAKNPLEWFFWTGWGLYILLRVIFYVFWFIIRIAVFSKGRRM